MNSAIAAILAALGLTFLFAGDETAPLVFGTALPQPVPSLLAALWLGSAAMTWTARGSLLGGVYGRAVVTGNQVHFFIGALSLLNYRFALSAPGALALLAFYVAGAGFYTYVLFWASPATADRARR